MPEGHKKTDGVLPGPLHFGRLGREEGLPSAGVYSIAQDGRGFLYFGTRSGLARYDGHEMKVLLHDDRNPASLPSTDVTALATDRAGRLWVGTDGGLSRLVPESDRFVHIVDPRRDPKGLLGEGVNVLFVDSSDTLWIGLKSGGVATVHCPSGTLQILPVLASSQLSSVAQKPDGKILLGTRGEGVLVYDPKANRIVAHYSTRPNAPVMLPADEVSSIHVDDRARTWIGTVADGLLSIDKDGKVVTYEHEGSNPRSLSDDHVTVIFRGPDHGVWVGTQLDGLNQYDESTGGFVHYSSDPSDRDRLSSSEITAGAMTRDGVVWIGTANDDVNYFDALGLAFKFYRSTSTPIMSIAEDAIKPNTFWMGSPPGMARSGLYRVDRQTGRYTLFQGLRSGDQLLDLKQAWISALHSDRKGTLWIGTQALGLLAYRPQEQTVAQIAVGAEDAPGKVNAILSDPSGALWIGTWGDGLVKLTPTTGFVEHFTSADGEESSVSSDYIYTVVRDKQDPRYLWVGTAEGGLNRFDTARGTATRFVHSRENASSLSNNNVTSIHQDAAGRLWIGTFGGGLNRFDPRARTWKRYGSTGQPSAVFGVLEDSSGNLWLSTNGDGLRKLDPKTDQITVYSAHDGLQSDEFAQGGFHRGPSGVLYFGGVKGVTAFKPEELPGKKFTPSMVLTDFRVFDESRPVPAGEEELSYLDSVVSLQYAALEFADPRRVEYEYRLSGLHDRWTTTKEHSVTYAGLNPGAYVFELRARGRHGAPSAATLAIPFQVAPPPWLTWWAYALYGLAAIGVVLAFIRYQRRKIIRIEQQNRLATVEREIELTAAVHSGFLPETSQVEDDGFGLVGVYRPAGQCSGDWWWHERVNGHVHVIACGDVTGHGPGPAMVTASVSTTFRVMRSVWAESGPREFLRIANEQVMRSGRGQYLMQMMVAEFDTLSGQLSLYSAAGFPAVCLIGGQFKTLTAPGAPLGTQKFDVTEVTASLTPGDRFMLLTDGIAEIELVNGRRLGMRRLTKIYEDTASMPLSDAAAHLLAAAETANYRREQEDDWTFVIAEWARRPGAAPRRRTSQ